MTYQGKDKMITVDHYRDVWLMDKMQNTTAYKIVMATNISCFWSYVIFSILTMDPNMSVTNLPYLPKNMSLSTTQVGLIT